MLIKYIYFTTICLSCVILITYKLYYSNQSFRINKLRNDATHRISFRLSVQKFFQQLYENNVDLILIDPKCLFKLIQYNHTKVLIARKLISESMIENENKETTNCETASVISFAILQNHVRSFEAILEKYVTKRVVGENGSKRHWNYTQENTVNVPLHYLIYFKDIILQITVFYARNEFYWSGKLSENVIQEFQSTLKTKIQFGLYEQSFDKFNLEKVLTNDNLMAYHIPKEIVHFISEIESSRFIECDFDTARWFRSNYEQVLVESTYVNGKALQAIKALKILTKQLSLPFWISGGTLLGWFRQCGVIPYTEDIDCVTWAQYASEEITKQFIENNVGLDLQFIYGLIGNGYQYALYSQQSFRVDLFFMYKEGNNNTITGHIPSKNAYFRYIYPPFTLCSAELIGVKVLVPCNAQLLIQTEYGLHWKIPKTFWSYVNSALNTGPLNYWKDEERTKIVYQEFFG